MGNVILVVAQNFRDSELIDTKEALQKKGFKCDIASKTDDVVKGADGMEITPDITLQDAVIGVDMYEAVAFIGGPGTNAYFDDKEAQGLAKTSSSKGKITAAVCIAPMILAKAGVLDGKKATVWDGNQEQSLYFKNNNIEFTDELVTVDGNIVTGNGPGAAKAFGEKITELLDNK